MLSEKLKELRDNKNYKQNELIDYLGISQATLSNYETGRRMPSYETLIKIAKFYNVTTDYLLGHEINKNENIDKLTLEEKRAINTIIKSLANKKTEN